MALYLANDNTRRNPTPVNFPNVNHPHQVAQRKVDINTLIYRDSKEIV